MGFKQRERRRKAKAAKSAAQSRSRESRTSADKWWLTVATSKCCCARCATIVPVGGEVVYRHSPRETRCQRCALELQDSRGFRTSLRWDQERARRRKANAAA